MNMTYIELVAGKPSRREVLDAELEVAAIKNKQS